MSGEAELATLRAHLRQAVEALEPFAAFANKFRASDDNDVWDFDGVKIKEGNFRRARDCRATLTAALSDQPPAPANPE